MLVYRYQPGTKIYLGPEEALKDPLESELQKKDIYLLPANCTYVAPPEEKEGFNLVYNGVAWELQALPKEQEPEKAPEPTAEELKAQELAALDAAYENDKQQLLNYYAEAALTDNTELIADLKAELKSLNDTYDKDRTSIEAE